LRNTFQQIDTNGDGFLSPSELKTFLQSQNINLTFNEINQIISQADINGDGYLNFYEFIKAFTENVPQ
jgi:Ca2+-binding EF-hand superfamily protein